MLREPAFLLLGEDQLAVGQDVVLALRALFDLGYVVGLVIQLGRETRGPYVVAVSDGAVLDQDLRHDENLPALDRLELLERLAAVLAVTKRPARRGAEDVLELRVRGVAVGTPEALALKLH